MERRHEHARAAGRAPHATVRRAGLGAVGVARLELAILDPQLAVAQAQLIDPGVPTPGASRTNPGAIQLAPRFRGVAPDRRA